ncbi:erythromycin esterase family protein [Nonomuraea coxensis]|uniref:erythromycin esterase family protein n=1 Tax=Nonomuraea coxensis TaxID=404386 RepID=UPI0007C54B15|nr:erythromycin esterase family protein [Nonomuraea coxensis]
MANGALLLAPAPAQAVPSQDAAVVHVLDRSAYPLRSTDPRTDLHDLRPLGRMVGDAGVVGVGEATHGSHEFFTNKHRIFRFLVESKGFSSFIQEVGWGSGLRLNDYVLHGTGDLRQIMREEFINEYALWNNEEYYNLLRWMRAYNATHHDKLQYVGDDVVYSHRRIFQEIFSYVHERRPGLLPRFRALYRGLIPVGDVKEWQRRYDAQPLAVRQRLLRQAERALTLLRTLRRGPQDRDAVWAEQQAAVVVRIARLSSTDDPQAISNFRDQGMAENTAWWYRNMHSKSLLSAHNAHIGYVGFAGQHDIYRQGARLRDMLGDGYTNFGLTFYQGSFNAWPADSTLQGPLQEFTVGPPPRINSETVLDRVRYRDFYFDMRTIAQPARDWLDEERPVRNIGGAYPQEDDVLALRQAYDNLIHLHQVTASHLLPPAAAPRGTRRG